MPTKTPAIALYPYQRAWLADKARFKIGMFARQTGKTFTTTLEIVDDFSEIGFGVWEGRSVAEVHDADPLAIAQFWRDPVAHPIPGGEPVEIFDRRIRRAWDGLMRRYHCRHVLLVAHGGAIRMILRQLLDMPVRRIWRIEVPFAALSRIRRHRDPEVDPHLVFHNGRLV